MTQAPAQPTQPRPPPRDAAAALESAGGDADLAQELFAALLDGLPGDLDRLRIRFDAADWPGLAELAHRIRGGTRYCGVPALDAAVEGLERAARLADPELIRQGFAQVQHESQRLRDAGP